ncbi:MAG: hypothetical protein LBU80_05190 [Rikenellaceae bacterium]|jgi:hypothetical protein|nr:hypothetical protein [Rikenellaceae bacterium]
MQKNNLQPFASFRFRPEEIAVREDQVMEMLRQDDLSENDPVTGAVREVLGRLPEICDIRGGYALFDDVEIDLAGGRVVVDGVPLDTGCRVAGYLRGSERIALFVCTAGEGFSEWRARYEAQFDYLGGFVVDTLGSMVVERAMDRIQDMLERRVTESHEKISNRYSPGYCNWPLADQQVLFGLLPANECGIALTESSLMLPIKSVSGLIGIGPRIERRPYGCAICESAACLYRQIRHK